MIVVGCLRTCEKAVATDLKVLALPISWGGCETLPEISIMTTHSLPDMPLWKVIDD
jgi:cystathionine beta-lyase/cystathionine gamma-synthase